MPDRPCPNCASRGPRHLECTSKLASFDYYRCAPCGHVWAVAKDGTGRISHITPLTPDPEPRARRPALERYAR
jgi:hypothetical protein